MPSISYASAPFLPLVARAIPLLAENIRRDAECYQVLMDKRRRRAPTFLDWSYDSKALGPTFMDCVQGSFYNRYASR